jgi:ubiquinone/menaquinone biosynthesis C-methylase UbiE
MNGAGARYDVSESVPIGYVPPEYLRTVAETDAIKALKARALELMRLTDGLSAIDVGCGIGIDTLAMAELVAPNGRVIGIDSDSGMVEEANRTAEARGLATIVHHVCALASSLPYADDVFDAWHAERVFQHMSALEHGAALNEARRVTRPRGAIVVADTDWGTLSIASSYPWLERRVAVSQALRLTSGLAGRELFYECLALGLRVRHVEQFALQLDISSVEYLLRGVDIAMVANGWAYPAQLAAWWADLRERAAYGGFYAQLTINLVACENVK